MFENIPVWLIEKVEALNRDDKLDRGNRGQVYYAASGWTIAWYLRVDIQSAGVDDFHIPLDKESSSDDDYLWHAHVNRALLIAETLFLLRNSPGFNELRARLENRQLRPSFFEMLAAKQFFKEGFQIDARSEVGIRGKDFDFIARRENETVNVEVTAFEADRFSDSTILNALRHKRSQLPADHPGVIYCVMPERWLDGSVNINTELDRITPKFLRSTKRVNAVVFWAEQRMDFFHDGVPGSVSGLVRNTYFNTRPRNPIELSFLSGGWRRSEDVWRSVRTGDGLEEMTEESYDSEYFHWIDRMVPAIEDS